MYKAFQYVPIEKDTLPALSSGGENHTKNNQIKIPKTFAGRVAASAWTANMTLKLELYPSVALNLTLGEKQQKIAVPCPLEAKINPPQKSTHNTKNCFWTCFCFSSDPKHDIKLELYPSYIGNLTLGENSEKLQLVGINS